jgi:outer membrane lipoprotein-sorting protein
MSTNLPGKVKEMNTRLLILKKTVLLVALLSVTVSGCVGLGERVAREGIPTDADASVTEILNAISANQQFQTFRATGTFILRTRQWEAVQKLPLSSIAFRRPGDFYITGRKHAAEIVRLGGTQKALLMELPRRKEFFFLDTVETTSELNYLTLARDLFFFGLPENITRRNVKRVSERVTEEGLQVVLETKKNVISKKLRWRIEITGLPWVITKRELLDSEGSVIATTTFEDYRVQNGVFFPKKMTATLPAQNASMRFDMKKIQLSPKFDEERIALTNRIRFLEDKGHRRGELNQEEILAQ